MMKFKLCVTASRVFFILSMILSISLADNIIPGSNSGLYYQMGGGNDVPMPAFYDTEYVPLEASGDVGLGFDCGAFNPGTSIQNSLNEIQSSSLNVEREVLENATAAVTEFPLYELSRADPNLYNLISTAMGGAREDMAASTKSCEVMQSEIGTGGDPYSEWGQLSLGNRWKEEIGDAEVSGNGDINQAQLSVSQDAGKNGVPWVDPNSDNSTQTVEAGGENQAPIQVIHDSAMSGYNTIANDGLDSVGNQHLLGASQSELVQVFPTAKSAADWVTNVVGDETITTYDGGVKSSQPGTGLTTDIETETQQIQPKLQALVSGATPVTVANLQALSPEGMALSPEIITDIQNQPSVIQNIIIEKLAQNIAAMNVIDKARLAIQILQTGSRVPAIYSNKAAQKNIQAAIEELQHEVADVLMFVQAGQTLMSNMLSTVTSAATNQQQRNTAISVPSTNSPELQEGALIQLNTSNVIK